MTSRSRILDKLARGLEARFVKVLLAALIIVSVLPVRGLEETLRPLFLVVFGIELALRFVLLRRPGAPSPRLERLLFALDFLAFLSFLPLERLLHAHAVVALPVLRLSRLLLLVRFTRELALDLYSIVTRREQLHQFGLVTAAVWALAFGSAVVLDHLGITHDYDGREIQGQASFIDRLWWSFRQLESADNLVEHLHVHPAVALLSLGLTVVGVFVISFIIGIGANVVDQVVRAERRRPVGYAGHALVVGAVHEAEMLVREFVGLYERNSTLRRIRLSEIWQWLVRHGPLPRRHALPRMVLLGPRDEPPDYLMDPLMRWVVYRQGDGAEPEALARVGASEVKRVLVLARADAGPDADAVTAMALASLRAFNTRAQVFVEVRESQNRELLRAAGGPGTFPLDMPRILGLFLCQHLVTPGVEALYADLMTTDGSEFYTHLFVDEGDGAALARLGDVDGTISFVRMAREAYRARGVILTGIFLGEEEPHRALGGLPRVEGLVQWLNPLRTPVPGSPVARFGARAGRIPARKLRGLIGVSAGYAPLRRYGRDLVMGRGMARAEKGEGREEQGEREAEVGSAGDTAFGSEESRSVARWARGLALTTGAASRVLVVGYSATLPALLHELARFVPGVEVILVLGERGDERMPLGERLGSLGLGLDPAQAPPGAEGATAALPHGGRATVYTQTGHDLTSFAVQAVAGSGPLSAAVFLREPEAVDGDARTALRLLRFVRALEHRELAPGERLHLVVEFDSVAKGEHIRRLVDAHRCGFDGPEGLRVTLISTERIKNYFMVHSAFVPGVTSLYDEILGEEGQEIVRLDPAREDLAGTPAGARLGFGGLLEALAPRGLIPVALEHEDGRVMLNPPPQLAFSLRQIRAVFALAEIQELEPPEVAALRARSAAV
ncbi:hypothetical protein [Chondromyces apiculatus]|uniref:Ion transport domain-containing protein n=1 Tax=Chondromyces apiculatus DSM 436 TaxID=1192034 RepID=A0A017T5Z9_9BACT|nr:hypothetical protein [Chondromyces apiculatus]EYF04683.1 Hypothetical protein CAP_4359 [Chondromyces apiculatus DSM 436]